MRYTDLEFATPKQQKYGFYIIVWDYKKANPNKTCTEIANALDMQFADVNGALQAYANFHCKRPRRKVCHHNPKCAS
jgi:hypothetical protein